MSFQIAKRAGLGCANRLNRNPHRPVRAVRVQAEADGARSSRRTEEPSHPGRRQLLAGMALFAGCPCCMQATAAAEGIEEPAFSYGARGITQSVKESFELPANAGLLVGLGG